MFSRENPPNYFINIFGRKPTKLWFHKCFWEKNPLDYDFRNVFERKPTRLRLHKYFWEKTHQSMTYNINEKSHQVRMKGTSWPILESISKQLKGRKIQSEFQKLQRLLFDSTVSTVSNPKGVHSRRKEPKKGIQWWMSLTNISL